MPDSADLDKASRIPMTHYLYLVRHGEHLDAEHGLEDGPLSPRGRRQAALLADRI